MITIGTFKRDGDGRERRLQLDPSKLVKTRMLVTANSGGGKSYLLRVLLEQLGQSTPIIVLDREGDYVTLGEKLDVVQVGPQGEIPAAVRSAGMLCRRLMEKRLSAVIDLSELPFDRHKKETLIGQQRVYVREFLDQLTSLPRKLWRPTFIVLDEVHLFAPEKGHGESESTAAVINAATLGRKRAYCTLMATQRISKLHKDAAADQLNRLFGGITLDVDVERAAKDLGMTPKEARPILRELPVGEFYGFGPALSERGVVRFHGAKAQTTHPEPGQGRTLRPPKPSKAIAAVLSEFTDIPKEAEQEINDLAAAKAKITELERDLRRRPKEQVTRERTVEIPSKRDRQTIARLRAGLEELMKVSAELKTKAAAAVAGGGELVDAETIRAAIDAAVATVLKAAANKAARRNVDWERTRREVDRSLERARQLLGATASNGAAEATPAPAHAKHTTRHVERVPPPVTDDDDEEDDDDDEAADDVQPAEGLSKPQQKTLNALAWWESVGVDAVAREQLGAVAGISSSGGYLDKVLRGPSSLGLIARAGGTTSLTDAGRKVAVVPRATPDLSSYHKKLRGVIKSAVSRKIFDALVAAGPRTWTREQIGEATNISSSGGYLDKVLRPLSTIGLIDRAKGVTTTTKILFPDELA